MRHRSALRFSKFSSGILTAALFLLTAGAAQAQVTLPFDGLDWLMDRGQTTAFGADGNGNPVRPGYNSYNTAGNDPGPAVRRWVWPFTRDITNDPSAGTSLTPANLIIDNPNPADPNPGNRAVPNNVGALSYLINGGGQTWTFPTLANRAPGQGFSIGTDTTQVYNYDYAYVNAVHDDFTVDRSNGVTSAATRDELAALPNAAPSVYKAVQNELIANAKPTAIWTSGVLAVGSYAIDLHSPGDGTLETDPNNNTKTIARPNVTRALVRVSWGPNTTPGGTPNTDLTVAANPINDPVNSRIFLVDLGTNGWIRIVGGGLTTSAFPDRGGVDNQLVVALYALTPDSLTGSAFVNPPIVTADACRFTLVTQNGSQPNLNFNQNIASSIDNTISSAGRILGPVVGTSKVQIAAPDTDAEPLYYFAREESIADIAIRSHTDPTNGNSGTSVDPTAMGTAPVFYCIDNTNGNVQTTVGGVTTYVSSTGKVRWRYVGAIDDATGTSSASPLLADVRCRDGQTRPMVFFVTTSSSGAFGHIYAFDPHGNRPKHNTTLYWTYPSARPLANDPNVFQSAVGAYSTLNGSLDPNGNAIPAPYATKPDQSVIGNPTDPNPVLLYDGEIAKGTNGTPLVDTNGNNYLAPRTKVPFGGMQAAPMLINDPTNPTGPQILVVPNMNGRVYAFDAGGRGDFGPFGGGFAPGTTQRLWTWPRVTRDLATYLKIAFNSNTLPANETSKGAFPSTATFDANQTTNPIALGAADGFFYALSANHDDVNGIKTNADGTKQIIGTDRMQWQFPSTRAGNGGGLGATVGTATLYQPNGNGAGADHTADEYIFTAGGRAYAILANAQHNVTVNSTVQKIANLAWAYPNPAKKTGANTFPEDPATADPNVDTTTPIDPGFNGTAPLVIPQVTFTPDPVNNAGVTTTVDLCYALSSNGTLYCLTAKPTDAVNFYTTPYATGNSTTFAHTACSPILTLVTPQADLTQTNTTRQPMIVFADDSGNIYGLGAVPVQPPDPAENNPPGVVDGNYLPLLWRHFDSGSARSASASLIGGDVFNNVNSAGINHGVIVEGDEGGQLRAYSFGDGTSGLSSTVGIGERIDPIDGGDGTVSIDIRGLDIFDADSYDQFVANNTYTPGGGNPPPALSPISTGAKNGNLNAGTAYAFEWGDKMLVAAWGVYHAMPTSSLDKKLNEFGTEAPNIQVTFTISQGTARGGAQPPTTVTMNANQMIGSTTSYNTLNNEDKRFWPIDLASKLDNEKKVNGLDYLTIWGIDPNDPADPNNQKMPPDPTRKKIIGTKNGVYPWIAVTSIPIIPSGTNPFTPGSSAFHVSASARITQNISLRTTDANNNTEKITPLGTKADFTPSITLGQSDPDGKAEGLQEDPKPVAGRATYIAHPLAISVRNYARNADNSAADVTTGNNIVGWTNKPIGLPNEVLGNGNRLVVPNSTRGTVRSIYAPMGSLENNTTGTYQAWDGTKQVSGLFVTDRSNFAFATGRRLGVKAATHSMNWHGGPSSVMNPLPWDKLPVDGLGSDDYPNLSADAIHITKTNGQDLVTAPENDAPTLDPPSVGKSDKYNNVDPDSRKLNPTELTMTVSIPKYFPANMNWGTFKTSGFGSDYKDVLSGGVFGFDAPIVGPLRTSDGAAVDYSSSIASPAGGFIGEMILRAALREVSSPPFSAEQIYNDSSSVNVNSISNPIQAYRAMVVGTGVMPTIKLRVNEETVDLGKMSHGTGYSDIISGRSRAPFAPSGTNPWANAPTTGATDPTTVWNSYFRPFTVYNESNVNLIDVRVAKMLGPNNAAVGAGSLSGTNGYAAALRFESTYVNGLATAPLFGMGFADDAYGVGNIGVVSTLDHPSLNSNYTKQNYREMPMFPLKNNYVTKSATSGNNGFNVNGVDAWDNSLNQAGNSLGPLLPITGPDRMNGFYLWLNGQQPQPTIHKARPSDGSGTVMTLPDVPYGETAPADSQPKISMAIPLGTPVGTYKAPIYVYEDNTPYQLRQWQNLSIGDTTGRDHDAVLNVGADRNPNEAFTKPYFSLQVTVTETRLTGDASPGTLAQLDPMSIINGVTRNPLKLSPSLGANLQPAAVMLPNMFGSNVPGIALFTTTNRQQNSTLLDGTTGTPLARAPFALAYSRLSLPYNVFTDTSGSKFTFFDANFSRPSPSNINYGTDSLWWDKPLLFTGQTAPNTPAQPSALFPSLASEATNSASVLPGTRVDATARFASPAVAALPNGSAAFLFWQGAIDKIHPGPQATQQTDSRTFYQPLGADGTPNGPTYSFLNDPALTKLGPKPLITDTLIAGKAASLLYLFWYAGNQGQTGIYYNVNNDGKGFLPGGWGQDIKLPTPGGLVWQSDPCPVFRSQIQIFHPDETDPVKQYTVQDCIDVVFTGVLKGRPTVETLLIRYAIDPKDGTLTVAPLPRVSREVMGHDTRSDTFIGRDAAWYLGSQRAGTVRLETFNGTKFDPINARGNGIIQRGRLDPASGLVYYGSSLGGQVVVDIRTGTVHFPNIPPSSKQPLYVSYIPQMMRLNVPRDDSNLDRSNLNTPVTNAVLMSKPTSLINGSHYSPVVVLDRSPNPRSVYTSPRVVPVGTPTDRMWVLYRKSDPGRSVDGTTIYYRAMRLMVKLPTPIQMNNGAITLTVSKNKGAYEVDWVRGRIYFTEADEDSQVDVAYTSNDGKTTYQFTYRVAWGDESPAGEKALLTDSSVNEGQPAAFMDLYQNRLWVFWSSTRNGLSDLYYEAIAPMLDASASNQQ